MILGYLGWLRILLLQTKKAAETFWQVSLEKDSLVVLAFTVVLFTFILFCGTCRFPVICGMLTILFVHVAGFGISLLVRPLYVARYASPLLGVFAVTAAVAIAPCKERLRSRVSGYLMIVLIAGYIVGAGFEYNGSLRNFRQDFDQEVSREDVFCTMIPLLGSCHIIIRRTGISVHTGSRGLLLLHVWSTGQGMILSH